MTIKQEKRETGSNLFAVSLTELEKGPVPLKRSIPQEILKDRLKYCEYGLEVPTAKVDLQLERCSGGVLVRGSIDATIHTQCGTCLADTVIRVTPEVSTYMSHVNEMKDDSKKGEFTPEDLEKEWFDGQTIVLDELLLDTLMLEVPMNPKCGDSCPGLTAISSLEDQETNIDPRLAPLVGFKLEKER